MLKRLLLVLLGISILALIVFLGFESADDTKFVVWFGLASAIGAPAGIAAIGAAFKPAQNELLERLAKVPEIERLIDEAKSQEEKVRALEIERQQLSDLVKFESLRLSLIARKDLIESEGVRLLKALDEIDDDLKHLDIQVEESGLKDQIELLRQRVRLEDRDSIVVFIAGRRIVINVSALRSNPLGEVLLGYIILFRELSRFINRLFFRNL